MRLMTPHLSLLHLTFGEGFHIVCSFCLVTGECRDRCWELRTSNQGNFPALYTTIGVCNRDCVHLNKCTTSLKDAILRSPLFVLLSQQGILLLQKHYGETILGSIMSCKTEMSVYNRFNTHLLLCRSSYFQRPSKQFHVNTCTNIISA